jgi:AAA15 family ATPase/GTPase
MITELSLENFKSWKKIKKMKFGPVTGLFGANSSGKTSIL